MLPELRRMEGSDQTVIGFFDLECKAPAMTNKTKTNKKENSFIVILETRDDTYIAHSV